jgi:hypothetical protein
VGTEPVFYGSKLRGVKEVAQFEKRFVSGHRFSDAANAPRGISRLSVDTRTAAAKAASAALRGRMPEGMR